MAWPENAIIETKIGYIANDQQCYNVLHWIPDVSGAGQTPAELSEALVTRLASSATTPGGLINHMRTLMSDEVQINQLTAQCIWPTRYRAFIGDVSYGGLVADACDAQNVAAVIQKFGDQANRHNIGSLHLGGLAITMYEGGELTVAAKALLLNVANAMLADMDVVGPPAVNYSPVILNKGQPVGSPPGTIEIIGYTELVGTDTKETLRVMRRRTKGYGI